MLKCFKFLFVWVSCCANSLFAQEVNGVVKDVSSRAPIANAKVITSKSSIFTNGEGIFKLRDVKVGTALAIRIMGYETIELTINGLSDTLRIYLRQSSITLNEVLVKTKRNYKLDSLDLRKQYASSFVYKGPSFSDMFIGRDPDYDSPFAFTNPKSTASLVSLNLLQVASLFGKKKVQNTRLKQTLIRDEQLNYVDEIFSKEKIKSITGLEGEALIKFMDFYRPSILNLKKMTGYQLTLYIKKSFEEFSKAKSNH